MTGGRVVVVGSANWDRVATVPRLPARGETVVAGSGGGGQGGKGANQAVAAVAAGAPAALVGAVGDDDTGRALLAALAAAGVDTAAVVVVDEPTGEAFVVVEAGTGENLIVVTGGANGRLDAALAGWAPAAGDVVVAQLEARPDLVAGVLVAARAAGAITVLNAAPAAAEGRDAAAHADVVVVNEVELAALVPGGAAAGAGGGSGPAGPAVEDMVRRLAADSGAAVVATLGAAGAVAVPAGGGALLRVPAPVVDVVDTTGAGDCFVGCLAARLVAGAPLDDAVRAAVAAASDSVTRPGATGSLPAGRSAPTA